MKWLHDRIWFDFDYYLSHFIHLNILLNRWQRNKESLFIIERENIGNVGECLKELLKHDIREKFNLTRMEKLNKFYQSAIFLFKILKVVTIKRIFKSNYIIILIIIFVINFYSRRIGILQLLLIIIISNNFNNFDAIKFSWSDKNSCQSHIKFLNGACISRFYKILPENIR